MINPYSLTFLHAHDAACTYVAASVPHSAAIEPAMFQQKLTAAFKTQANVDQVCFPFTAASKCALLPSLLCLCACAGGG